MNNKLMRIVNLYLKHLFFTTWRQTRRAQHNMWFYHWAILYYWTSRLIRHIMFILNTPIGHNCARKFWNCNDVRYANSSSDSITKASYWKQSNESECWRQWYESARTISPEYNRPHRIVESNLVSSNEYISFELVKSATWRTDDWC